ncbi:MAG: extracellular solute-binding protein [Patescibacteria group bacterium]
MANLKPFQVIIMGIFGFIALAGLFLFANFQGFSNGQVQVGTVSIWGTLPASSMNSALMAFKEAHQEYGKVTYTERPQETFDADVAEAIASGRGPDLLILSQEDLLAAQAKISPIPSSDLSERDFRDNYLPIHELYLIQGGTYAIPFLVDPLVLYYNRPILASSGAVQPPATWEAVTGLAATVNRQTDTQTVTRSLIALGTYENVENARAIISLLFLQAGYGISERTPTGVRSSLSDPVDDVFGMTPSESALNFYTEFSNPGKTVYSWNRSLPNSRQAFIAGDLALYLGFASERAELAATNPNLDFDMSAAPMPGTNATRTTYGRAYGFSIPRATQNGEGALRVALTLSERDSVPLFARAFGMAPAHRGALAPLAGDLYEPVYYPEALVARAWLSPAPADTDRIFATMINNVLSGREGISSAITTVSQSLNAAFK